MLWKNNPIEETQELFDNQVNLPKNKLNPQGVSADTAYRLIHDEMLDEGQARQNLATFCQTYMEPEGQQIMADFLAVNAIDKTEYPQMAEVENRCVNILSALWSGEENKALGTSTVGSSEACMLGGLALKFRWKKLASAAGIDISQKKPNLVISSAYQICWEKFCVYHEVELRKVPISDTDITLDTKAALNSVDEYTIGIIGIAGITYTGGLDDIYALDKAVDNYNSTATVPIGIHVDAASGGLFLPFVSSEKVWDFRLKNVVSINTSGHKYGLVYPGIGWILWRSQEYLPEELIFKVSYLGGEEPTMAINFSRSGSQIIGQYYIFLRYGFEGLSQIQQHTLSIAQGLAKAMEKLALFTFVHNAKDLPILCYQLDPTLNLSWSLYDLSDYLRMSGWQVPTYCLPENLSDRVIQRLVIRADFSSVMAENFLRDLENAVNELQKNGGSKGKPSPDKAKVYGFIH